MPQKLAQLNTLAYVTLNVFIEPSVLLIFGGEWSVSHAARCNWEVLLQADQLNLASYVTCFINLQDQG